MADYFPLFVPHDTLSAPTAIQPKRRFLRRFLAAIRESRRKRSERAIARYIAGSGFTDSVELEIERRFLSG